MILHRQLEKQLNYVLNKGIKPVLREIEKKA